jgi:putative peptide zinc metalloprotease protein
VTQQPRVSSNAPVEEAFVPLGRSGSQGRRSDPDSQERRRREQAAQAALAARREPRPDRERPAADGGRAPATERRAPGARRGAVATRPGPEAPAPSAADFTAERYLRDHSLAPRDGWRRVLFWLTGGRVNFGPSPGELAERELIARAKTPVPGCRSIAVISRKGGVGKTTTTLMLGHTFASLRGDRVVALDGNPDAGSLGYRVRRETAATITNLLADEQMIDRYADIRAYTSQAPTRLEVVASDDDPRITTALGEEDYRRAIALLERHYNLICLDTGTGVLESATRGILQLADQIVVVMSPSLDSARAASSTLDWLNENGHAELVRGAVAVVNGVQADGQVEVGRIKEHFAGRCRDVVQVPWDPHLAAGAETEVTRLRPTTRHAYLEVAAAVADGFVS